MHISPDTLLSVTSLALVLSCTGNISGDASGSCGDGWLDPTEACDGQPPAADSCVFHGYPGGTLGCTPQCEIDLSRCLPPEGSTCGDGAIERLEQCEGEDLGGATCRSLGFDGGTLSCSGCQFIVSGCEGEGPLCGDGIQAGIEACDGDDLGEATCRNLGFHSGELSCNAQCGLDLSACAVCGNGLLEADEICDTDAPIACTELGFDAGQATCSADCEVDTSTCVRLDCGNGVVDTEEDCEPALPSTKACADLPDFDAGTLGCQPSCSFDTSSCTRCGDERAEGDETCDGVDLAGLTCATLPGESFDGGTLRCLATCAGYDTTDCQRCGDGMVSGGEQCEGTSPGGTSCADLDAFDGGTLVCDPLTCHFDTTACTTCGDGQVTGGEPCDGDDLQGQSCVGAGFDSGQIACLPDCSAFDTSGCVRDPGEPDEFSGMTAAHNAVRAATGAGMPDLVWDDDVAAYAQAWSDEVAQNRGCTLQHRPRDGGEWSQIYGENAYKGWAPPTAQQVVDMWASELADYDYETNTCSAVCGHYTQIVWATSRRLGCGMTTCDSGTLVYCNYDPPGNWIGQSPY